MATYWFKQRRYGMGATPSTSQGWVLMLVFLAVIIACVALVLVAGANNSPAGVIAAFAALLIATLVMIWVSWRKTEGGWRWRWGDER